jgi:hypothetical protein
MLMPDTPAEARLGENRCQQARLCSASQYLICEAYREGTLNCWEVEGKPCCKRDAFARCEECFVYLRALGREVPPGQAGLEE